METAQQKIRIFHNRHLLVGPVFWIVSLQYFIIQFIVARAWPQPFSLKTHVISDLGNTACGMYADRYVCSPLYPLMNISFVALGLLMIAGSVLIYQGFRQNFGSRTGFTLMALAGFV